MARYWFKPRRYGRGPAPVTWEGWLLMISCCANVVVSVVAMELWVDRANFVAWTIWAAAILAVTYGFVSLARSKTDGEWRWRWGEGSDA